METLETSRLCRLCGKQSGILINIFDKNENHVKKINAVLPIMVHEMDLLPKHMCHRCSYKLEEYYKFYAECLKTDGNLKSQLSWMRKEDTTETIRIPMVHIENLRIKVESPDYESFELDPIVDNVNYINSMGSVAYVNSVQANGIHDDITFAAYTRCGCCCDKNDQSHAVSTDYKDSISRCSRLNCAGTSSEGCKLQTNKEENLKRKSLLVDDAFHDNQSCPSIPKQRKGKLSSTLNMDDATEKSICKKEVVASSTIVRNLRPRRGSVDYVGTRRKSNLNSSKSVKKSSLPSNIQVSPIKLEKSDEFEGRTLRPRNTAIDYFKTKRHSKSIDKNQRSQIEEHPVKEYKVQDVVKGNVTMKKVSKLFGKRTVKLSIKQELLSGIEDTVQDDLISPKSPGIRKSRRSTGEPIQKDDALPNPVEQHDIINYSMPNCAQPSDSFCIDSKIQSPEIATKKGSMNGEITYSPKFLRSRDADLGNGKVNKLNNVKRSVRKLRKSIRIMDQRPKLRTNLMKSFARTVERKKVAAAIKLIDRKIKHYCEECNTSFANKELYRLHGCYH